MTPEEIKIRVADIIADGLNVPKLQVTPDMSFKDLGADSLDSVEVIMELEKKFDIKIDDSDAEKVLTVADAIKCVEDNLKNKIS